VPRSRTADKKPIEQYEHKGKQRPNNPPVGLVTPETDRDSGKRKYAYDPHLDPQLQWAGKAEHTSFEIPTVSLHVHERIDPRSIIEAVRKKNGQDYEQLSLFASRDENPPLREAIEFYKHSHNWSNRLIAGDSLLVMNSLLEKEGMAGKVQMVYIDPPYGIKYGSNFQPFVNNREVKDGKDEDLTQEPEMIKAFRDTWELGIHSYLTYLRDRLLLARGLLHESGSAFVQISDENVHHVREIMDEVFGATNFIGLIIFQKKGSQSGDFVPPICEYLVWYARNKATTKFHALYLPRDLAGVGGSGFNYVELKNGNVRELTDDEAEGTSSLPDGAKVFRYNPLFSAKSGPNEPVEIEGKLYPSGGNSWKVSPTHIPRLFKLGRVVAQKTRLVFKRYANDFNFVSYSNVWMGMGGASGKIYVVQTNVEVVKRCLLMTTDPGDLVLDITCGSGTTAYVAEWWGRRWVTCDTSRVAIAVAKQRLMTAVFDYYQLAHEDEGVGSGFKYKTVPHVTLKSIANNTPPEPESLYDQPADDQSKARVTGPFTVEAVPAPMVRVLDDVGTLAGKKEAKLHAEDVGVVYAITTAPSEGLTADLSIGRSGETLRQAEWRDELFRTGIRGKGGQKVEFTRVEPCAGTRWLHATAETKESKPQLVAVSFGPEHAPLEQRQVELAIEEAQKLVPKPKMIVFAAFQFDPEASKDIDETSWPGVVLLKAQMNADLLTEDLKKKRASNESFWLIGQPDIDLDEIKKGTDKGKYQVKVQGFDYYDTRSGTIESGGTEKIAMWMLDTDYDGRSLFPRQVFFPLADDKGGWARLAKDLKTEIDEELIEAYRGTESLPFEPGKHKRVAVKIIDDRGIESLKVLRVD
jgi:adenine-specific DNA-methyltransferase